MRHCLKKPRFANPVPGRVVLDPVMGLCKGFKHSLRARQPRFSHQDSFDTIGRRHTRIHRLHPRAKLRLQPSRKARCVAQSSPRITVPRRDTRRHSSTDCTSRRGLVIANLIVIPTEPNPKARRRLGAHQSRAQDRLKRCAPCLTNSDCSRDYNRAHMADMGKMRIIIIQRMAHSSIGECRHPRSRTAAKEKRSLTLPASIRQRTLGHGITLCSAAHNQPIQQTETHHISRRARQLRLSLRFIERRQCLKCIHP